MSDLLPIPIIAKHLGLDRMRLDNWRRFGICGEKLKTKRCGSRVLVRMSDVKRFIAKWMPKGVKRG